MSADTLTDAGAEVLRVLSSGPSTYERISRLASRRPIGTLAVLTRQKLATHGGGQDSYARWSITPAGREALARHESEMSA